MKAGTLLPLAVAVVVALSTAASAAETCAGAAGPRMARLTVESVGLRAAQGEVAVTVYPDDPSRFLARGGKVARLRPAAVLPATGACFWLPPGTYAVAVYHDQNGDHQFNRNHLGLPAEGFGFSNDAPTRFSMPAFAATRFTLPAGGRTLRVRMRYQTKPG
jgi:uncharacterized protein (DUF2141 family)